MNFGVCVYTHRASIFIKVHLVWAMAVDVWSFTYTHSLFLSNLSLCFTRCCAACVYLVHLPTPHHFCSHSISHFTHLLAHHVQQIIIYRSWLCLCSHVLDVNMDQYCCFGLVWSGLAAPLLCSIVFCTHFLLFFITRLIYSHFFLLLLLLFRIIKYAQQPYTHKTNTYILSPHVFRVFRSLISFYLVYVHMVVCCFFLLLFFVRSACFFSRIISFLDFAWISLFILISH